MLATAICWRGNAGRAVMELVCRAVLCVRARSRIAAREVAQPLLCSFEARRTVGQQLLVSELIAAGAHPRLNLAPRWCFPVVVFWKSGLLLLLDFLRPVPMAFVISISPAFALPDLVGAHTNTVFQFLGSHHGSLLVRVPMIVGIRPRKTEQRGGCSRIGETGPLIVAQLVGMPLSRSGDLSRVDVTRRTSREYVMSRELQLAKASRKRCAPSEVCGEHQQIA